MISMFTLDNQSIKKVIRYCSIYSHKYPKITQFDLYSKYLVNVSFLLYEITAQILYYFIDQNIVNICLIRFLNWVYLIQSKCKHNELIN